jgi:hypothetical protein
MLAEELAFRQTVAVTCLDLDPEALRYDLCHSKLSADITY